VNSLENRRVLLDEAGRRILVRIENFADSIENTSPCWSTWQFPIERVCGMLLPLARSRLHPYKNIINNIHVWEMFNHLQFYQIMNTTIFPLQKSSTIQIILHILNLILKKYCDLHQKSIILVGQN
jgi:hypothetical protein